MSFKIISKKLNLKITTMILELHSSINLRDWSGQMFYNNLRIKCNLQYAYQQVTVQIYSTPGSTTIRHAGVSSHHKVTQEYCIISKHWLPASLFKVRKTSSLWVRLYVCCEQICKPKFFFFCFVKWEILAAWRETFQSRI